MSSDYEVDFKLCEMFVPGDLRQGGTTILRTIKDTRTFDSDMIKGYNPLTHTSTPRRWIDEIKRMHLEDPFRVYARIEPRYQSAKGIIPMAMYLKGRGIPVLYKIDDNQRWQLL